MAEDEERSMSMRSMARDLEMVSQAIHSMFVYAACTADGFVKVGISGKPAERIYQVHLGSPSPVRAAQWAWIGSRNWARQIERDVKREWAARNTRGEWYLFDYSLQADKVEFHATLAAVIEVVTGKPPEWHKLHADAVAALIQEHQQAKAPAKRIRNLSAPWHAESKRRG